MPNPLLDYNPESEALASTSRVGLAAESFEFGETGLLDEGDQIELGSRFLETRTHAELDGLLGEVIARAVGARAERSAATLGRALRAVLHEPARRVLSALGRPLEGLGSHRVERSAAGDIAGLASYFGLALEGLSLEDQEFEVARAFIRLAGSAAELAATAPHGAPLACAQRALVRSARRFAPGLVRPAPRISTSRQSIS